MAEGISTFLIFINLLHGYDLGTEAAPKDLQGFWMSKVPFPGMHKEAALLLWRHVDPGAVLTRGQRPKCPLGALSFPTLKLTQFLSIQVDLKDLIWLDIENVFLL